MSEMTSLEAFRLEPAAASVEKEIRSFLTRHEIERKSQYKQSAHVAFIIMTLSKGIEMSEAQKHWAAGVLAHKGLGGNHSQFAQWLAKDAPKGLGALDDDGGGAGATIAAFMD